MLAALAVSAAAEAQNTIEPYASAQVDHDSNIHRVPNSQVALLEYGDPTLGDSDAKVIAGLNGNYQWGLQQLTSTLEGRRIDYDHFTDLNHFEYLANIQLKWTLSRLLDGLVQFRQTRVSAPFQNNDSTTLELDTDRSVAAKFNVNFHPDWRLDAAITAHTLDAPLQFYPDYVENDTTTHLGLTYLGISRLTYGISVDHINGNYRNGVGAGPYSQTDGMLNINYLVSGLTKLNASIGYTRRTQDIPGADVSGFTGSLGYSRQLTGKTSVTVQAIRAVNDYLAAGGAEVDTSVSAGVNWAATYKLSVNANYGYVHSVFEGQAIPDSLANGRVDHSPTEMVNVSYRWFRHLQLKAYYMGQSRSSTYDLYSYSDTTYGIQALWCFGGSAACIH